MNVLDLKCTGVPLIDTDSDIVLNSSAEINRTLKWSVWTGGYPESPYGRKISPSPVLKITHTIFMHMYSEVPCSFYGYKAAVVFCEQKSQETFQNEPFRMSQAP